MEFRLYLRFTGSDQDDSEVALSELGESLVGFDSIFQEFARILHLEGGVEVSATASRDGSLIIDTVLALSDATSLGFDSFQALLNALELARDPLFHAAQISYNTLEGAHRTLNDWVAANPIDAGVITTILAKAYQKLMEKARHNKERPDYNDREVPRQISEDLHKLVKKGAFKKPLSPIADDAVKSIEVSADPSFDTAATVNEANFQEYLSEEEQILPHLIDGAFERLVGKITSLRGTRGDAMTFHLEHNGKTFNLNTFPPEGTTSKDFTAVYQEDVVMLAWIARESLYKKPRLKLSAIELLQPELPLSE